jgi:hypothetical protein
MKGYKGIGAGAYKHVVRTEPDAIIAITEYKGNV